MKILLRLFFKIFRPSMPPKWVIKRINVVALNKGLKTTSTFSNIRHLYLQDYSTQQIAQKLKEQNLANVSPGRVYMFLWYMFYKYLNNYKLNENWTLNK